MNKKTFNLDLFKEMQKLKKQNVPLEQNYARNKLINDNYNLVKFVVNKYFCSNENFEDLISIGTIGLITAVDSFDVNKGIKFSTYASEAIKNQILSHLKLSNCDNRIIHKYTISLNTPISSNDDGKDMTIEGTISDEDSHEFPDKIAQKDENKYLREQLKYLTVNEQIVLVLRYGLYENKSNSLREVSRILGRSVNRVRSEEKRAIDKLKIIFNNNSESKKIKNYIYPTIKSFSDYCQYKSIGIIKKIEKKDNLKEFQSEIKNNVQLLPYSELFKKAKVTLDEIKENLVHLTPMEQFALCSTYEIYDQKKAQFNPSIIATTILEENLDKARKKLATLIKGKHKKSYSYFDMCAELERQTYQLIMSQKDMIEYLSKVRHQLIIKEK